MKSKRLDILWRVYTVLVLLVLGGMAIGARSFHIQVSQGDELIAKADSLTIFARSIEAERGNIYSADGGLLSTSLPFFEVRIDFRSEAMLARGRTDIVPRLDSLGEVLAATYGERSASSWSADLREHFDAGDRYYLVRRRVTYPELKEMKTWPLFNLGRYPSGMVIVQKNKRVMPFGMLAHRTIGYVRSDGEDTIAVGIEGRFDRELSGEQGRMLVQRIAGGTLIPLEGTGDIAPRPGFDIHTTIDVTVQDIVESALDRAMQRHQAAHGTVVLMEVSTGRIRAIANLTRIDGDYLEYYNYAVGAATEPGSTFKLASVAALLEDGLATPETVVDLADGTRTYADDAVMRDSKEPDTPYVSLARAFEISSNVGISGIVDEAYRGRPDDFYERLEAMGVTRPLGIEIVGEPQPTVPEPADWSAISLPWMSIGYEVSMTPLQMLNLYNTVANDGVMVKPFLVESIREYDRVVDAFEPVTLADDVLSDETIGELRAMMEGVVSDGTARNIRSDKVTLAGKTGTSRVANERVSYGDRRYQASFAGYFPADDPLYSCIVLIHDPRQGGYYGNQVAAPVFREIAERIHASSLPMHPVLNDDEPPLPDHLPVLANARIDDARTIYDALGISFHAEVNSPYGRLSQDGHSVRAEPNTVLDDRVPDVEGMDLSDALHVLGNAGLRVDVNGVGRVVEQSPDAGSDLPASRTITLRLR